MELQDYTRVFRAHWIAIVLATLFGAVAAFGWTLLQPKVYTSTGSAIIVTGNSSSLGDALAGDTYAKSRVKSYVDIAKSRQVGTFAVEKLGLEASADALVARVTVTNPLDTAVLRVSAQGATPEEARALTEAWIEGMTVAVEDIETGDEPGGTTVVQLQTLDSASLPGGPSSPNTKLAVALGTLVGAAMGVAYALVKASLDRRLRRTEDVEREFEVPVVGALPYDQDIAKAGAAATTDFAMKESVRQLRTNLQFMDVDNPPRVMVVTSSLPGDGKSTTVITLAEAIAQSGQDVVLIDADLRRPSITKNLGLVEGAGLTDVLVGRATANDVLQPHGRSGHLFVLGAGAIPPNPSELLASQAMKTLLYSFPEHVIVLIDTPPLIPVTDAAVLTARTDGALVVVRSGKTTIDVLDRAFQSLDRVKGRPLGVILAAVPRKGAHKDAYSYAYEYDTAGATTASAASRATATPGAATASPASTHPPTPTASPMSPDQPSDWDHIVGAPRAEGDRAV